MARGNTLGSATIALELEYAKVSKGIDQVNKKLGSFEKGLKKISGRMKAAFSVGAIVGFGATVSKTLDSLDNIGKTADKIGLTTDALQEMRFAAEQAGISSRQLDMGLQRFIRRTAEAAKGTGELKQVYADLGIELKNADGSLRGIEEVMYDYADAIANTEDAQEQLRLAFKGFDSEGAALVNLFREGAIGVEELRQQLRDVGGVIDESLIRESEAANDALNTLSKALSGMFTTALANLAPYIKNFATWVSDATIKIREFFQSLKPTAALGVVALKKAILETAGGLEKIEKQVRDTEAKVGRHGGNVGMFAAWDEQAENARKELERLRDELRLAEEGLMVFDGTGRQVNKTLGGVSKSTKGATLGFRKIGDQLSTLVSGYHDYRDGLINAQRETENLNTYLGILDDLLMDNKISVELHEKALQDLTGTFVETSGAVDDTTDTIFDLDEALKTVQSNIQSGFSDLFNDLFSGKGIDSVKDFAKRVLDIFKRLFADIAAAWVTSKIFNLDINLGKDLGSSIAQGIAKPGGLKSIGGKVAAAVGKIFGGGGAGGGSTLFSGGLGKLFSGGGGGLGKMFSGFKNLFSGNGIGSLGGLAAIGSIAAYGFGKLAKNKQRKQEAQQRFAGIDAVTQQLNPVTAFRGIDEATGKFFITLNEGWSSTLEALTEANVLIKAQGALYDENGNELVEMTGNLEGVKAALSGATATGFEFKGSLEGAIEKGNSLRVAIQGDAEQIKMALEAATGMGIGGFQNLETTATGVSATLTGDIQRWNEFLQSFVNNAIQSAISGVSSLEDGARGATEAFLELARAASKAGSSRSSAGLKRFATGGISNEPAIFGEAGPEAAVPLPDGRTIPVTIKGGMSDGETNQLLRKLIKVVERSNMQGLALA